MTFLTSATAALWYQSHLPHIPVRVLSEDDELRRVVAEMGGSKHLPLLESSLWILASWGNRHYFNEIEEFYITTDILTIIALSYQQA